MTLNTSITDAANFLDKVSTYNTHVKKLSTQHSGPLPLQLSPQILPIVSATYDAPNKLLIVEQSSQHTEYLTSYLNHLTQQLKLPDTWHNISGSLTEQEINGDICSTLSLCLHHFLSISTHHHFVLPLALTALKLPSRQKYTTNQIVWHRHAKVSQSVLINQLITIGYRRHRSSIEPGTFVVRGEQLLVKHHVQSGHYIITLYGPSLEKLEYYDNTRRHPLTKIHLLPVSFPTKQTTLDNLVSPFMIIRPAHAQLSGNPTVISNALQPDLAFPDITIPLSMRPAPIKKTSTISRSSSLALLNRLQENKPAVHSDHGIGIYEGMKKRTINNYTKDYLILRYAAGDILSVPVEYSFKVSPYLGDATPTIHRLGGNAWVKSRHHAQRDAVAFAQELLKNEALRQQSVRPHYQLEPALDDWLDKTFPYELTPDQISTWRDIQADLTSDTPMDRLVIGDVGFGKTELAIRAACHAINNHQQVALLAPTTILVQQHYDLFIGRLPHLATQIVSLSRFSTTANKHTVRNKIASGDVSIVIGTHSLLTKNTLWHNLGLVIIDEEQRFGVAHKEHFKKLRSRVDLLSLTATPIPRTLSMALSNLKQLSVISTPPPGRKNVITWVGHDNDDIIRQALLRELQRGGQLYVIAPKISHLSALAHRITNLAPDARLAILHGQMTNQQIASTMQQFDHRQIDILISSTIIANGLDLPHANTVIVTRATHFGLSDLYQLRGRIGRRKKQGYALFLYNQTDLSSIQRQRLTALTEASRLGSGWSLARRDLEIRGAGNLLGEQQSGSVNAVGVQLYLDMVNEAIDKSSGQPILRHDLNINLPLSTHIPTEYIPDLSARTEYYQKLSRSRTLEELTANFTQIIDQFGPAPSSLSNLYHLLQIQHLAALRHVLQIDTRRITPSGQPPFYRVIISFAKLPSTTNTANSLPDNWVLNNNNLILTTPTITPDTLQQISILLNTLN